MYTMKEDELYSSGIFVSELDEDENFDNSEAGYADSDDEDLDDEDLGGEDEDEPIAPDWGKGDDWN